MNTRSHGDIGPELERRPLRVLALEALDRALREAERGRVNLVSPRITHRYDATQGKHFHLHPEFLVQVSGVSLMKFPDETLTVRGGDVIVVPHGISHEEHVDPDGGFFCNLVFDYGDNGVGMHSAVGCVNGRPSIKDFAELAKEDSREIHRHLDGISELAHLRDRRSVAAVRGLLMAHLASLASLVDAPPLEAAAGPFRIRYCRRLVMTHLTDPAMNVAMLARWMSCSADYLSHTFRLAEGMTLTRFINSRRILHAQELLKTTTMNVSEVAHASGYDDPAYFARVFRSHVHATPRQYRLNLHAVSLPGGHAGATA